MNNFCNQTVLLPFLVSFLIGFATTLSAKDGIILSNLGDSLLSIQQYDKAEKYYQKAIEIYKKSSNWDSLIQIELKIVLLTVERDSLAKAIRLGRNLVKKAENKLLTKSELLASIYHKNGVLNYSNYNDSLAIYYYKKAIEVREGNNSREQEVIVRGYRNIGESYEYLGKVDSAKFHLEKAFDLIQSLDSLTDTSLELEVYQLLGRIYQTYGDLDKAKEFLSYQIRFYNNEEVLSLKQLKSKATALGDYGTILRDLFLFKDAVDSFLGALEILKNIPDSENTKADILNNFGTCYYKMKRYKQGLYVLIESLELNQKMDRTKSIQLNYLNIGLIQNKMGNYQKALDILLNKVQIDFLSGKSMVSSLYDNIGDAYISLKNYKDGINYYNKALGLAARNFNPLEIKDNPTILDINIPRKDILTTFASKANALDLFYEVDKNAKYLNASFLTYQKIDSLITKIRQNFLAENSKLSLVKETKPIYEKAIEISLKLYELSKEEKYKNAAFDFIQKSKAVTLSEAVRHTQSTSFLDVDLSKEKYLNIDINRLTEKSYSTDGISVEEQEQLINLKNEKEKFVKYLEQNNPAYFNYKYNNKTVDQEELINILEEETTLVEFFVGDSTCFVSTYITDNQLNIYEIPISRKRLSELVSNFTKAIYSPFVANKNKISLNETDATYANIGHELYRLLLEPLKVKTKKLIIIPDDILNTLPFDALLTQKVPEESVGYYGNKVDYNFLLYKHEISYNYGVSLMKQAKAQNYASIKNQLAVYSTPDFINQVAELKEIFGDWDEFFKVINKKGNNQSFQETANTYKYIHLSAHGILNNEDANRSYFNMSTSEDDFIPLYLSTLYNIQINAEMVVTSACDAGIGKVSAGEGILSMARGFFYAGAKSVITSLWEVQDGFTGKLLKNFYQNLKDGKDKGGALNQAKQNFIRTQGDDFARPYYWAAFVPIGKMESVEIPFLLPFNVKVLLGFVMSFFIIGLSKFLINNNQSPSAV